ncbi:unnamed protein product [Orchesella dallaii]|uniref:Uncharacterized protein n=1 Tax=Orchesella dallaii TaxID=48710 RepID=A0ABP1S7W7_9HEXA
MVSTSTTESVAQFLSAFASGVCFTAACLWDLNLFSLLSTLYTCTISLLISSHPISVHIELNYIARTVLELHNCQHFFLVRYSGCTLLFICLNRTNSSSVI